MGFIPGWGTYGKLPIDVSHITVCPYSVKSMNVLLVEDLKNNNNKRTIPDPALSSSMILNKLA